MPAITPGMVPAQGPGQSKFFELPAQHMFQALANKQAEYDVQATELINLGDFADAAKIHQSYTDGFGVITNDIDNAINELSSGQIDLSSPEGVRAVEQLRRRVRSIYGANGPIGKMMAATAAYDEKVKNLQETYKNDPLAGQAYIKALKPIDLDIKSLTGSIDGSLTEQPLPEIIRKTNEEINSAFATALNITGKQGSSEYSIQNIGDIFTGLQRKDITEQTATNILTSLKNTLTSTRDLMDSFTLEEYITLDNDPRFNDLSPIEKWDLAGEGANKRIDDLIISQAKSSSSIITQKSMETLYNALAPTKKGEEGPGAKPIIFNQPSPPEDQEDLNKRSLRELTGLSINENGDVLKPLTFSEFLAIQAEGDLPEEERGRYEFTYLEEDKLPESFPQEYKAYQEAGYENQREMFNTTLEMLTSNGFNFESEADAAKFIMTNFDNISRYRQVSLITPSGISASSNINPFSSGLQSISQSITLSNESLVRSPENSLDASPTNLKAYIAKATDLKERHVKINTKDSTITSITEDGKLVVNVSYYHENGDSPGRINVVLDSFDIPNLKNIAAPIREVNELLKNSTRNDKNSLNNKLILAAGNSVPLKLAYPTYTTFINNVPEQINVASARLKYLPIDEKNPEVKQLYIVLNTQLPDENGYYNPFTEYEVPWTVYKSDVVDRLTEYVSGGINR